MSRIKLGDKVKFVNENMQGVVTRLDGNIAGVTIEDDFEIPVTVSEIVKIVEETIVPQEKQVTQKPHFVRIHSGIHIAFDRISETLLELKLHNSEAELVLFAFSETTKEGSIIRKTGEIELEKTAILGRYDIEKFNGWPQLTFQVMFVSPGEPKVRDQLVRSIKFSAKDFHASFRQCYFLGRQAYTFRLDNALESVDLEKLRQKDFSSPAQTGPALLIDPQQKPGSVIDLHIEKLTADHKTMQAAEMVQLQMDTFAKMLDSAYASGMKSLTVIHGAGNHFLKNKIRNYLGRQRSMVANYTDADMSRYGGGATEITFK